MGGEIIVAGLHFLSAAPVHALLFMDTFCSELQIALKVLN